MLENLTGKELVDQFKSNKKLKIVTFAVGGLVILVAGYFIYSELVYKPKNEESKEKVYVGLNYAAVDSTDMAIKELEPFVKKYDGYQGGEIAQFTLARQLMTKRDFKGAIKHLEGVDTDDTFTPALVQKLLGDCHSELKDYKKASEHYIAGSEINPNDATTPMCLMAAGECAEELKDFKTALTLYMKIKNEYPTSQEGTQIDKYIGRVESKKQ